MIQQFDISAWRFVYWTAGLVNVWRVRESERERERERENRCLCLDFPWDKSCNAAADFRLIWIYVIIFTISKYSCHPFPPNPISIAVTVIS